MKITVRSTTHSFEMRANNSPDAFAIGIHDELPTAMEVARRVNNYDTLVEALRAVLRNQSIAGVIAADALTAAREG
jgi:hypothetical protein